MERSKRDVLVDFLISHSISQERIASTLEKMKVKNGKEPVLEELSVLCYEKKNTHKANHPMSSNSHTTAVANRSRHLFTLYLVVVEFYIIRSTSESHLFVFQWFVQEREESLTVYLLGKNLCMRKEYNCFDGSQCIPMEKFCNGVSVIESSATLSST